MPVLKTRLIIDGQPVTTQELKQDHSQKNRFIARQWLPRQFSKQAKASVEFYKDNHLEKTLSLLPSPEKEVLTMNEDEKAAYFWGTLTRGYGKTVGFTAGIMARKVKKEFPPIEGKDGAQC